MRTTEVDVVGGCEVPTIMVDDGIAGDNEKGDDEPLLAEGRDTEVEVVVGCEVPTIEVDDDIAGDNEKGDDELLLSGERDTKHDQRQEAMVEKHAPAPAPSCDDDDDDSWLAIEEVSDADCEEAQIRKEADQVDLSSWSDDEVVENGVVPTPI